MTEPEPQALSPLSRERIYRRNFKYFLADSILFTVAISIIGSSTVIPDFVRHLTDSEIVIGLFSTLFTVGYTLPQLFIARYIVRYSRKKWWFVGPNIPVRLVILIFAGITVWLGKERPELILLAFFICYSIAAFGDGLVGVPWADLAGTSLNSRWRARMFGLTTAVTGVTMLLLAPVIGAILGDSGPGFPYNYAILFAISGLIFALSTVPGLFIHELPGGKAKERPPTFGEFLPDLGRVLRDDKPFRAFMVTQMLTSLFMMATPFYIGYATVRLGLSSAVAVPVLLAMQTAGSIAGAVLYTWLGERNNVLYMRLALISAALLPSSALLAGVVGPLPLYAGFLVSGLATGSNLLSCYLNWLVGYADPDQRPMYVGLSNTAAALVSIVAPIIGGAIVQNLGYQLLFTTSLVIALTALFVAFRYLSNKVAQRGHEEAPETAVGSSTA